MGVVKVCRKRSSFYFILRLFFTLLVKNAHINLLSHFWETCTKSVNHILKTIVTHTPWKSTHLKLHGVLINDLQWQTYIHKTKCCSAKILVHYYSNLKESIHNIALGLNLFPLNSHPTYYLIYQKTMFFFLFINCII